jgi:hypothetical protein
MFSFGKKKDKLESKEEKEKRKREKKEKKADPAASSRSQFYQSIPKRWTVLQTTTVTIVYAMT